MSTEEVDQDLTRKERREHARAQRRALEEAEAAAASRRARLTRLGIVVSVVVVAIVVVLVATGSGGSKPVKLGTKQSNVIAGEVSSLLNGIPQAGNALGSAKAPVTLEYFGDLQCPICKEFTLGALPTLINRLVSAGTLRIEYRSFETATHEPEVFKSQQVAALAAGKQDKMWNYVELFYHEQGEENSGYVTESFLRGLAQQVPGLNLAKWTSERTNAALTNEVSEDAQTVNTEGFTGTPSFLIGRSGGAMSKFEYPSLTDPTGFEEAIEKLAKA